jgi:predicted ATPase/DNA-binding winged helix-turn-helix (wHTH) protein
MQAEQVVGFGPYRFALSGEQLWRGQHAVKLTPKALVLLRALVTRAGELVTKEELLQIGWPQTVVSDYALTACIKDLRRALRDDSRQPRFIGTVHRRGFRFIGKVVNHQQHPVARKKEAARIQGQAPTSLAPTPGARHPTPPLVGRDGELAQLEAWFDAALNGARQLVFVTGEPGIGKTALVEAFLTRLADKHGHEPQLRIGRGQCIEQYGAGEAYLPLLDAMGRLGRQAGDQRLVEVLSQQAPTWLVQLPALITATTLELLQRQTQGAARQRMLRELAEAIEQLAAEGPLVLWLEDLHWGDVSTLEWLAYMARRREPARLLVIGSYRPVEVLVREHPLRGLKQELQVHGECAELLLDFLSEEAVAEYLAVRFSLGTSSALLPDLAQTIHRRTDGNPLFLVNVVNDLVARGMLVQRDDRWELQGRVEEVAASVPESLQQLIAQQVERLSPETRRMLEVGSVAGAEFSAAAVAAGMEIDVETVEQQGEELVRREHFLRASGTAEWPDGTVAARYAFLHAFYQDVVYHRLTARQRQWLHQRIGEREEVGYGARAKEIAAELAVHFEQGRDYRRAVQYLQQSGWNAVRRCAPQEAINLLTKGLKLLKTWPDTPERLQQEVTLLNTLMPALMFSRGPAAPELENVFARKRELCEQLSWGPESLFWTLMGLCLVHVNRAGYQTAHELAEQCLHLAQGARGSTHQLIWGHYMLGVTFFCHGDFVLARSHQEQSIALYDPQQHRSHTFRQGHNPQVSALQYVALVLWHLGYPDQALKRIHNALTLAHELSHPYTLGDLLGYATLLHQYRREARRVQEQAEAVLTLSAEQGFPFLSALATLLQGWVLADQGHGEQGIAQVHQGLAALRATGAESWRPYFLALLAEAYGKTGQAEEGLSVLAEALATVHKTGERHYEAELYRLKGDLTLAQSSVHLASSVTNPNSPTPDPQTQAETCFLQAIEIARRQQAKSLELRATMSLARLWQQQGKRERARQKLAEIYTWFTEGFDTRDLQEAQALMEELTSRESPSKSKSLPDTRFHTY